MSYADGLLATGERSIHREKPALVRPRVADARCAILA